MTIPSRPAPAPPRQRPQSQQNSAVGTNNVPIKLPPPPPVTSFQRTYSSKHEPKQTTLDAQNDRSSITRHFPAARYAPATSWDGSPFETPQPPNTTVAKKAPPPRPPPPRISPNSTGNTVLKKPGPPQSINMLSNLFGRKKSSAKSRPITTQQSPSFNPLKLNVLPNSTPSNVYQNNHFTASQHSGTLATDSGDVELIKFDSPPSSPTFTQKSNSDCVSVDSFSSDSNFSSPQNGSVSQPESGFEDDFLSPTEPWDPFSGNNNSSSNVSVSRNYGFLNDIKITQPSVRNLNAINRSQNENPLCNGRSLLPPQETLHMPTIIRPKTSTASNSNSSSPVHALQQSTPSKSQVPSTLQMKSDNDVSTFYPEPFPSFEDGESSPPMPNCPPPPPPQSSMLDVISGRLDAISLYNDSESVDSTSYGIALYDFEGLEDGDLSFRENERIYLLQRLNDEWYLGRNKRGCEGIFPANYIEVKVPLKCDTPTASNSNFAGQNKIRVLFNFNAEVQEDLTLKENDMVTVLYRINDDWLFGELGNKRGQFPANFLEYIPDNLPNKMP